MVLHSGAAQTQVPGWQGPHLKTVAGEDRLWAVRQTG